MIIMCYRCFSDIMLISCFFPSLQEYASLQVGSRPQIHDGMEPAVPEVPHDCTNTCNKVSRKKSSDYMLLINVKLTVLVHHESNNRSRQSLKIERRQKRSYEVKKGTSDTCSYKTFIFIGD